MRGGELNGLKLIVRKVDSDAREEQSLLAAGGEGQGWHRERASGLSCPLDAHDNDSVIGLVGHDLHPLSHRVQALRNTVQTSQYIQTLGPFFVGHALWQSPLGGPGARARH